MFAKVSFEEFSKAYTNYIVERAEEGLRPLYELDESTKKELWGAIELPVRSTPKSAGYDFRIPFKLVALPGRTYMVPTGIKANMERVCSQNETDGTCINCFLALYPRSSLGFNYGFCMDNTVGIIDQDYYNNENNEGHIMVGFTVQKAITFKPGDRFFQAVIEGYYTMPNELSPVNMSRTGGLGSTGK